MRRMNTARRNRLSFSLLGAAAATMALAPHLLRAQTTSGAHLTRPQKIADLVADLGYGRDTEHIDAAVPYLAKNALADNPGWGPSNPRWPAVCDLIRENLREDAQAAYGETEAAIVDTARHALSDSAELADIDAALAFFKSLPGRHFLELQNSLTDMSVEVGLDDAPDAAGNAVDNLDARRRLLQLWLPIVFIRIMYQGPTAELTLNATYDRFARKRGAQLDALSQRYGGELARFEAFLDTDSFAKILIAEKHASKQIQTPNLSLFFGEEARKHAADWRAAALHP